MDDFVQFTVDVLEGGLAGVIIALCTIVILLAVGKRP